MNYHKMQLLAYLLLMPTISLAFERTYNITNNCPSAINLYVNGVFDSVMPKDGQITKIFDNAQAESFYTDANGGSANDVGSTTAGFGGGAYYYIVVDPNKFNIGVSIFPAAPSRMGFCQAISSDNFDTSNTFTQAPGSFPTISSTAPLSPLFACPISGTVFFVTFCPSGAFPHLGTKIQPNFGNSGPKCLDVRGRVVANGTPVQIFDCNETPAQWWIINRGNTKVQVANTTFCLDAGSNPGNGVGMKIWQCFDNIPAQSWYYTDDNRIALFNQGLCLDLTNGNLTNGNQAQTWQCTSGNTNQIWTL